MAKHFKVWGRQASSLKHIQYSIWLEELQLISTKNTGRYPGTRQQDINKKKHVDTATSQIFFFAGA